MMMVSDDCLVECNIDDSDEEEEEEEGAVGENLRTPPPPPEFASKASTPACTRTPRPQTPPPLPTPSPPVTPPPPTPPPPVSRDPRGINRHLQVDVSDVLAEPAAPRSLDQVWFYSVSGFEKARYWTYLCLTTLLAVPLAFLCGVFLAVLACLHVWLAVPCLQLSSTFLPCLKDLCSCAVGELVAPLCSSLSLCCSHVAVSLSNKDWPKEKDKGAATV